MSSKVEKQSTQSGGKSKSKQGNPVNKQTNGKSSGGSNTTTATAAPTTTTTTTTTTPSSAAKKSATSQQTKKSTQQPPQAKMGQVASTADSLITIAPVVTSSSKKDLLPGIEIDLEGNEDFEKYRTSSTSVELDLDLVNQVFELCREVAGLDLDDEIKASLAHHASTQEATRNVKMEVDLNRKSQKRKMPEVSPPGSPPELEVTSIDKSNTKPVIVTSTKKKDVSFDPAYASKGPTYCPNEVESLTGILAMKKRLTESNAKVLRQQLLLLIHARVCKDELCPVHPCKDIKRILSHITQCTLGKTCKEVHCLPCKQLLFHWKNCSNKECLICPPIRKASAETILMPMKYPSLDSPSSPPVSGSSSSASSPRKGSVGSSSGSSSNRSSVSIPVASDRSKESVQTKQSVSSTASKNQQSSSTSQGNKTQTVRPHPQLQTAPQPQLQSYPQQNQIQKKHNKKKTDGKGDSKDVQETNVKTATRPVFDVTSLTKVQLIQHHLLMLLHASRCRKTTAKKPCSLPHCPVMKKVLSHVYKCSTPAEALVSTCRETFCFSSKVVILHWRSCVDENCVLCIPLRQADAIMRKPTPTATEESSQHSKEVPSSSDQIEQEDEEEDEGSMTKSLEELNKSCAVKSYAEI
jgi:hypothetical protein